MENEIEKVNGKRNNIRGIVVHKVLGQDFADKIEIPVLFSLTEESGREYHRETMCEYLHDIIDNLERHEELYH